MSDPELDYQLMRVCKQMIKVTKRGESVTLLAALTLINLYLIIDLGTWRQSRQIPNVLLEFQEMIQVLNLKERLRRPPEL